MSEIDLPPHTIAALTYDAATGINRVVATLAPPPPGQRLLCFVDERWRIGVYTVDPNTGAGMWVLEGRPGAFTPDVAQWQELPQ